jgi:hypothetical protein
MKALAILLLAAAVLTGVASPHRPTKPNKRLTPSAAPIATPQAKPTPIEVLSSFAAPLGNRIQWVECVSFMNTSAVPATAIQFDLILTNAFDDTIKEFRADREGMFSPNVRIDGPKDADEYNIFSPPDSLGNTSALIDNCWKVFLTEGSPTRLKVRILKVLFEDGSTWTNSDAAIH